MDVDLNGAWKKVVRASLFLDMGRDLGWEGSV